MKNCVLIWTIVLTIISISCNKNQSETKTVAPKVDSIQENTVTLEDNKRHLNVLEDFSELVPLTILDSTSQDVYEKYGIEFDGNCYNCDLAKIKITKKNFDFINVCDDDSIYRFEKFTYSKDNKTLIIKTEEHEFVLTKIDDAPIFKLTINGKELTLENKRIAVYFTQSKIINKFKEHDCGDFQG